MPVLITNRKLERKINPSSNPKRQAAINKCICICLAHSIVLTMHVLLVAFGNTKKGSSDYQTALPNYLSGDK